MNKDEELRNKVERLIGTAILKNDKNYTNEFMAIIHSHVIEALQKAHRQDGASDFDNATDEYIDSMIEELQKLKKELK